MASKQARKALSEEELEKLGSEKRLQLAPDTRAAGISSMLRRIHMQKASVLGEGGAGHGSAHELPAQFAHIAKVTGLGTAVCQNPKGDIQEEVIGAAKHIIEEERKAKQRKGASQLERQRDDAEKQPVMKQQKLSGSMSKAAAAEASAAWGGFFFECNVKKVRQVGGGLAGAYR
jgi:hypothetical protein